MRLAFIIPDSGFLLDARVFPSLGILKVAAAAEALGHDVSVIDLSGGDAHAWVPAADLINVDVFGITATMPQMPGAARIIQTLRELYPAARIILGGPHPTLLHASAKTGSERAQTAMAELADLVDVIVCGDGEKALALALAPDAPTLIDADDATSSLFLTKADLTDAPLPARHLIDLASYKYAINGHRTASLIAQLGCPFGCNFCGGRSSPFLRRVRVRSTASVLAEMRHLYTQYGYTGFMFLDDELNVNTQFMTLLDGIMALQVELGVDFRLRGLLKSELVTQEMADAMYRAGFRDVLVGFESGSPRMLLNMNKHATREDNTRCVAILKSAGIRVKALMSLGHPGESAVTVAETRDWLLESRPSDFDVTIITVYPGTPYFDQATPVAGGAHTHYGYTAKNGDRLYQIPTDHLRDENFYKGVPGQYKSYVYTETLSPWELVDARDRVEAEVRTQLNLTYPTSTAALHYEHSMGAQR